MKRVFLSTMLVFSIVLILVIVSAADFYVIPVKKRNYAPLPKTGQTTSYTTGDDGDLEMGVAWPIPRFTINTDDTVTDNLTGLIWLRDTGLCIGVNYPEFDTDGVAGDGAVTWQHALDFVAGINDGTYPNCGAGHTDWRLPNIRELLSLIHYGFISWAVPDTQGTGQWQLNDPFYVIGFHNRWSSTRSWNTGEALSVSLVTGSLDSTGKTSALPVWPVRGGR